MNEVSTLNLNIYEDNWFALSNEDMSQERFQSIIKSFIKIFVNEYGVVGAEKYIKTGEFTGKKVLLIDQQKVPNIAKSLVNMPEMNIEIKLTGKTNTGEIVTRTLAKPFKENECKELVPHYHPTTKR